MHDHPIESAQSPIQTQAHAEMKTLGSQISTDRPCASCSFNLFGQNILREPHYGLVVARCPECGTIASLQEYPQMTGWIGRWKVLLSVLWVLILLGALIGNFAIASALNIEGIETASENYGDMLGIAYREVETQSTTNTFRGSPRWTALDNDWAHENTGKILDQLGGIIEGANREIIWIWLGMALVMFLAGIFWSVVLLGARRRSALLVPLSAIAISSVVILVGTLASDPFNPMTGVWANSIAKHAYTPIFSPLNAAVMIAAAALGAWVGRPIARFVLCLMLPPRLRTPLGVLWTRDGLPAPKTSSY